MVAMLLLLAFATLVYLVVIAPIIAGFAARGRQRDRLDIAYAHNRHVIDTIPRLRRDALRQHAAAAFVLDTGAVDTGAADTGAVDTGAAGAGRDRLTDRLQTIVEQAGGEFRAGYDGEELPGWARVRATARMTLPQLTVALQQLRTTPPYPVIESLSIDAEDALVTGRSSILDVDIEASLPLRPTPTR